MTRSCPLFQLRPEGGSSLMSLRDGFGISCSVPATLSGSLRVCRFIVGKLRGSSCQSRASHEIRARFETWPRFHDIRPKGLMNPATRWCIELLASLPIHCGQTQGIKSPVRRMSQKRGQGPGPAFMTYARRDSRTRQLDDALSCLRVCRFIVGKLRGSSRQSGASHEIRARF